MSWQNGHYYMFSKLMILNGAPAESGIFGLYSSPDRIFLGESANIRDILLRLYRNMERFGLNRPNGFTFEICPPDSRMQKLRDLLAEYTSLDHTTHRNIRFG